MEATEPADAETHVVNFDEADANGDNVLDLAEYKKAMRDRGSRLSDEELEHLFNAFDLDGNGVVGRREFLQEQIASESLVAAELAARLLYTRVARSIAQFGWMLLVVGLCPFCFENMFGLLRFEPVVGSTVSYFSMVPWGFALLGLAVRPIDAAIIRCLGIFLFCLYILVLFPLLTLTSIDPELNNNNEPIEVCAGLTFALLCVLCAVLLWPVLVCGCCGCSDAWHLAPRRQLRRLWLIMRITFIGSFFHFGAMLVGRGTFQYGFDEFGDTAGMLIVACSNLLAAALLTAANRGRLLRRLGELVGKRGSKEQQAAAVAALLGGKCAAATMLRLSKGSFRALPIDALTRAEFVDNAPDPALHAKTVPARLGAVDAFVSHSWSDDGDAKFDRLHTWACDAHKQLWLEYATGAGAQIFSPPFLFRVL